MDETHSLLTAVLRANNSKNKGIASLNESVDVYMNDTDTNKT